MIDVIECITVTALVSLLVFVPLFSFLSDCDGSKQKSYIGHDGSRWAPGFGESPNEVKMQPCICPHCKKEFWTGKLEEV